MPVPAEASGRPASSDPVPERGPAPGRTPDGRVYWDPNVFQTELEQLFYRNWLCLGREEDLPDTGDYFTRKVGQESVLVVRGLTGEVRGFYNLCRHRGTRVAPGPGGTGAHSFACPYHAWTYGLDGRLLSARDLQSQPDFDRGEYGLHPIRVAAAAGFLWGHLEPQGAPLRDSLGPFLERFDRFPLSDLRLGGRKEYDVAANWKILVENFSECYHCAPVHPALNRLTPYQSGANDAWFRSQGGRSLFSGGFMEFAKDYQSMTRSGYTRRAPLPGTTSEDRRRVYYYVVFPNLFFSLHPDYLMIHRTWPVSPSHSHVENEFYFAPEAMTATDFDPGDAIDLWDEINQQDWAVCELAQEGMGSRAWRGGRYSDRERMVRDFDEFVAEELRRPSAASQIPPA